MIVIVEDRELEHEHHVRNWSTERLSIANPMLELNEDPTRNYRTRFRTYFPLLIGVTIKITPPTLK